MNREELAGKTKQKLSEIAKTLGVKGISKLTRDDLIEHILLLDPPFSANPDQEKEISQYLNNSLTGSDNLFGQPPLPQHLTGSVAVMTENETEIPQQYNETKIVLLVRDPYWLHSYWSVSQTTKDYVMSLFGDWNQIPLTLRIYDITNVNFNGINSNYYFDISINQQATNWYIHVGGPNRCFCVDLGVLPENGTFFTIARSNLVTTPRDNVSEIVDEEWMSIEEEFRKLYHLAGAGQGNSSAELVESLIKRLEREMGSGAISSLSSPSKLLPKERKFWLVLNTELIVYGATEPDANVTVQGEPIKLRSDGTFSMRFALPDGTQYIPVSAQSADEIDRITITPIVSRKTD